MAINFNKWDSMFKVSAEAVSDIKKNDNKERVDVPVGKYEVSIQKMELTESKKSGDPMASVWFKVLNGEFKNQYIFMNQMLTNEYGIHRFNEFMRSLDTTIDVEWTGSFGAYADLIDAVKDAVDKEGLEYYIDYTQNDKGYSAFKVLQVFAPEN